MMTTLQTLIDNGCSDIMIQSVLNDIIDNDSFESNDDKLCCIVLLFNREQGDGTDPDEYEIVTGDTVSIGSAEYRVLTDDEANDAVAESIRESVWAFCPSFLSGETGIDETVFEALADKCEDANDAVLSIINGSCGFEDFADSAVSADGRGCFLNHYDGEEYEVSVGDVEYYLYRVN